MSNIMPVHGGFVHEAAMYRSDEEFLDIVVPFLHDGVTAGEPTLLRVSARQEQMVRDALDGAAESINVLDSAERDTEPLTALRLNRDVLTRHVDGGATRVRIVGEVPYPDSAWSGWARYEASVNHFYAALPVWAICPYDMRNSTPSIVADVERTHARLATRDGAHRSNPRYSDPVDFLAEQARAAAEPFERRRPDLELTDPMLPDARLAVSTLALDTALDGRSVAGLAFAANEVLTNAIVHGRRPIVVRAWAARDQVVVAVRDSGTGPGNPYAGLLRDPQAHDSALNGDGLWLAHQMCNGVDMVTTPDGFTVYVMAQAKSDADGASSVDEAQP